MKKLLVLFAMIGASAFAAEVTDVKVEVLDSFGGDVGAVLNRCQTKKGAAYDPVTVTRDVTTLRDSGEFEDIRVNADRDGEGVAVTFSVKRKMRYHSPLVVKGCDYFAESRVAKESELKDGYLYGEGDLAAAADKVRTAYQKKYFLDAKVSASAKAIEGGSGCTVTFEIEEGPRRKVRGYVFEDAPHLEKSPWWSPAWWEPAESNIDEDEVRDAIGDYPWWNPIGWFNDAPITDEQLAICVSKIEEIYRNHGYLDVKVAMPGREECEDDPEKVNLCFQVREGLRYVVGETKIEGLTRYPEGVVREKSDIPAAGTVAGQKDLDDAAHRIAVTVGSGDSGLADTRVDVKRIPRMDDPQTLDLVFKVYEGVPVVINDIVIRGNDYTMDKVIRREIALGPGDRMLEDRAERSQKRLENLDYFSRVRYYLEKTDRGLDENGAEYRNLVYEVEEKNTGSFMVGVGASSVDSVFVSAEVTQSNFDLFAPDKWFRGAGQKGRAYVQWGPRIQTMEASVTEPHLFDRMLEFTVEGYRRGRWFDQYDIYRSGAAATLSYPVKFWPTWDPFGRFGIRYTLEYVQFDDVEKGEWSYKDRTVSLREEEREYGDAVESVVRLFWTRDTRDNFRMPTKGGRTQLFFDITAGGDNEYWRAGFNHRHYWTVWERYRHVFMAGIRYETIDGISDDIPIYDRMFLGGPRTIRGFEYRHVSPFAKRIDTHDDLPWGGQTLFCVNFEYTIPIVKMLRLALFSDLGSVGEDEFDTDLGDTFAWSAGLGFRIDLPMFPIRLDFAAPIETPDNADKEVFSFSVGYDF